MANSPFDKYHYLKTYGQTLELITYLAKYLHDSPSASEIPILGENNTQEAIARSEAIQLIRDYLSSHNAPEALLTKLSSKDLDPYTLTLAHEFLTRKIDENHLSLATREKMVSNYNEFLRTREGAIEPNSNLNRALMEFRSSVDAYHRSLNALETGLTGITLRERVNQQKSFDSILQSQEIITPEEVDELKQKLARIAPTVVASSRVGALPPEAAAHKTLEQLAAGDPLLTKFAVLTAEPENQKAFLELTTRATNHASSALNTTISEIQSQELKLLESTNRKLVLPRNSATSAISSRLAASPTITDRNFASLLANQVFEESILSAYKEGTPLATEDLVSRALAKVGSGIPSDQLRDARTTIIDTIKDFAPEIEAHNRVQILEATKKGFGLNVRNSSLGPLKPSTFFLPPEVRIALKSGLDPAQITQAIANPRSTGAREILTQLRGSLGGLDQLRLTGLISSRRLSYTFNKLRALEDSAWDKWFDFTDNLPHNRLYDAYFNWRYNLTERISETNLGWILTPLHRLDKVKASVSKRIINALEDSQTFSGRFFHRAFTLFAKGDYTLGGFAKESSLYLVSKTAKWAIKKVAKSAAFRSAQVALKAVAGKVSLWLAKKAAAWGIGSLAGVSTGGLGFILIAADLAWEGLKFLWKNRKKIFDVAKNVVNFIRGALTGLYLKLQAILTSAVTVVQGAIAAIAGYALGALSTALGFGIGALPTMAIFLGGWALIKFMPSIIAGVQSAFAAAATFVSGTLLPIVQAALASLSASIGGFITGTLGIVTLSTYFVVAALTTAEIPSTARISDSASEGSEYIHIAKEVSGLFDSELHIANSNLPQTLTYKITVTVDIPMTDIEISDETTLLQDNGGITQTTVHEVSETVASLAADEEYVIEYQLEAQSDYIDAYLINSVNVQATSGNGAEVKTNSLNVAIGTPPILPAAEFAIRLAQAILDCYGGDDVVSGSEIQSDGGGQCLYDYNDPQISLAVPFIVTSASSYTYLQCVGFVRGVMAGIGKSIDKTGDAFVYGQPPPPSGFELIPNTGGATPIPGDLFIIGTNVISNTGHIGVVTGDAGALVTIADANWNGEGITRPNGSMPKDVIGAYLRPL